MPRTLSRIKNTGPTPLAIAIVALIGLALLSAGLPGSLQHTAHAAAAAFTVNSTGDGADSDLADGVCNDGTGQCTLRAAIEQANHSAGDDTINITVTGTINLSRELTGLSNLTMTVPGRSAFVVRRGTAAYDPIQLLTTI